MRQMYTSARLANVEGVAQLLTDAGVEIKVTQGRSYKKVSRREFSFRDKQADTSNQPAVWVIKPDDYFRARQILHEAGLLDVSTTESSYLPEAVTFRDRTAGPDPQVRISRIRMALLAIVAAMAGLMALRMFFGR
jgi:hypothetical protein